MGKNFHSYTLFLEDAFSAGVWHLLRAFMLMNYTHHVVTLNLSLFWTHKADVLNEVFIVAVSGTGTWEGIELCAQPNGPLSSQVKLTLTVSPSDVHFPSWLNMATRPSIGNLLQCSTAILERRWLRSIHLCVQLICIDLPNGP